MIAEENKPKLPDNDDDRSFFSREGSPPKPLHRDPCGHRKPEILEALPGAAAADRERPENEGMIPHEDKPS